MLVKLALAINVFSLAIVFFLFLRYNSRERRQLKEREAQSRDLRQRVYQFQVLKEIGQRIGYELDSSKVVEILTSSVGNFLSYDTVSSLVIGPGGQLVWRCHVNGQISPSFVAEVKKLALEQAQRHLDSEGLPLGEVNEAVTGGLLDDEAKNIPKSVIHVPVMAGEHLVGLITVAASEENMYSVTQQQALASLAKQAGTALVHLQQLLQSERGKLKAVIDAMTDGVLVCTEDSHLLMWNPAARKMLGLAEGRDISMMDVVAVLGGKVDLRTSMEMALSRGEAVKATNVELEKRIVDVLVMPVRAVDGAHGGSVVVMRDLTSERQLEKVRQEFTAMMVHELRAPLTAIRWSAGGLMKKSEDASELPAPSVHETAVTIDLATKNMLELVNNLLDISKMESGKFELNIQSTNMVELLQQQVEIFRPLAESKHLELTAHLPDKLVAEVDGLRFGQVIANLLSNAIKYTDAGSITLSCALDPGGTNLHVVVADTGLGLATDEVPLLFSKFKQLGLGRTGERKGTGLGLVVVHGIVEGHGGKIWAESPGENLGTTFHVSLPVRHGNPSRLN